MNKIIFLELKHKLKSKKTIIIACIGILFSILVTYISINTATGRNIILDDNNNAIYTSGKQSVEYLKKTQKKYEGYITPKDYVKFAEKYYDISNKYGGLNSNIPLNVYAKEITPISSFLDIITYSFITSYEGELDTNGMFPMGFKADQAKATYNKRKESIKYSLKDEISSNSKLMKQIEERENRVDTPFYFSSYAGWDSLIYNYTLILSSLLILLSCILVSPTFSKEYENGSDKILRSAKYGRHQLARAKIISNLIVVLSLYSIYIMISFISACSILNINGLKASIQFINLFSSTSLNIGQILCINIFGTILAIITMTCFTLFLSASMKSSVIVLSISSMIVVVNNIYNIFTANNIDGNKLFYFINTLSPFGSNVLSSSVMSNSYLSIGSFDIWLPYATISFSVILTVIFLKFTVKNYCNHQE